MSTVNRAITVFSSDGSLLQVQYALESVRKGSSVVGVRGTDTIVIATEKRSVGCLQVSRIEQKMAKLDKHVMLAFAGLRADARVIVTRARIECQAHQLSLEDPVTVEYITKFIANLKQQYTQSTGRRPFGVSFIIGGFDPQGGAPHLFQTEPSGIIYEWKATAIGRNDGVIRSFLEKNYSASNTSCEDGCISLALQALMDQVPKKHPFNFDVAIIKPGSVQMMSPGDVAAFIEGIQRQSQASQLGKECSVKLKRHKFSHK